jgi:peptidoglycan hydrolase CwlO-like protein
MGLFGKKKEKVVDWSEGFRVSEKRISIEQSNATVSPTNSDSDSYADLGVLGNFANASSSQSSSSDVSWDNDSTQQSNYQQNDSSEKRQKLAKRLLNMTNKIEDLSNQIYHLSQRMELLEKKLKIVVD